MLSYKCEHIWNLVFGEFLFVHIYIIIRTLMLRVPNIQISIIDSYRLQSLFFLYFFKFTTVSSFYKRSDGIHSCPLGN